MQGHDLYILVKVTTKPFHAGRYGHFIVVKEAIDKALEKLALDPKKAKIHENFDVSLKDQASLDFAEEIEKAIDRKLEAKAEEIRDTIRELDRDVDSRIDGLRS